MLVQYSALTGSFVTNSTFKIMIQSDPSYASTQGSTAYLKQALAKYRSISTKKYYFGPFEGSFCLKRWLLIQV